MGPLRTLKNDTNVALAGHKRATIVGNQPVFGDGMALCEEKTTTNKGNGPVFADSMAWGRDKLSLNVGTNTGSGPKFSDSILVRCKLFGLGDGLGQSS